MIQEDIERILEHYLFEFNTPQTRREVKSLLETYMGGQQAAGLIQDYNVSDNTTYDIVDRQRMAFSITYQPRRNPNYLIVDVVMSMGEGIMDIRPRNSIKRHTL